MPDDIDTCLDPAAWACGLWLLERMADGNPVARELLRYVRWLEAANAELRAGVRDAAEMGY